MGKRRAWTEEEIDEAKRLYNDGVKIAEIGREVGRDKTSVRTKLIALGIHKVEKVYLYDVEAIRPYIIDVDEAKTITSQSNKKLLFKCSTDKCDNTKTMRVHSLVNQGYSCPNCNSNISYGERLMLSMDRYFNLGLEYQKRLPNLNLIFDFVDYPNKKVYEVQGLQHYKPNDFYGGAEQFGKQKASDLIKRNYCESIGWTYVAIDARYSDFNFIRDNINACEHLPNILPKDEQTIMELIELSSKYDIEEIIRLYEVEKLSTYQIGKRYGVSNTPIAKILKRKDIELRGYGKAKQVKCIETGVIYESAMDAMRETGIARTGISRVCNGKAKIAGGFHWEFVD